VIKLFPETFSPEGAELTKTDRTEMKLRFVLISIKNYKVEGLNIIEFD